MNASSNNSRTSFVGTIVGESTSREFRLAISAEAVREQDIIAVDSLLTSGVGSDRSGDVRVWQKFNGSNA
jgi:hypothetical protein